MLSLNTLKNLKEIGIDITRYYTDEMKNTDFSIICGDFGCKIKKTRDTRQKWLKL